ncbi:MAG: hypothetical protein NUW01_07055 [Gemmatimonadaceae bacterium]|nr:hypothetical protein [Gemmatimonadaceae bacterium]
MDEMDTAGLPLAEDTAPDLPQEPLPDAPETGEETGSETTAETAPETEDATSQFEESELEELASKDPTLKTWLEKKLKWERDKADESNRRKRENEVAQAKKAAEDSVLEQQYAAAVTRAQEAFGGQTAESFAKLVRYVAENGIPEDFSPEKYFGEMTNWLFDATRTTVALDAADKRAKLLATQYPEWSASPELVQDWTKALQSRDPQKLDLAYMKATAEAAQSMLKAQLSKEAEAAQETESQRKAKAEALKETEETRLSSDRPTRDLPASGGRRLTTPEELAKMPSQKVAQLARENPKELDRMIKEADDVAARRAKREAVRT